MEGNCAERALHAFMVATATIREPERADEALQNEDLFRILVDGVKDYAIFMLDPRGTIVSWNAGAERITGHRAEEIIGRPAAVFYTRDDVAAGALERELGVAAASGRFEGRGPRVRKDGAPFFADLVIVALRDSQGELRGFANVTR